VSEERSATRRRLGATSLSVSRVGVGGAPLGNLRSQYGETLADEEAHALVRAVFASELNFLDTSASYGKSEQRIGEVVRERGSVPAGFVLSSKADPDVESGAFDGDAVRRSCERSLSRLGVDRLALYMLHDPERMSFREGMSKRGPVRALVELRDQGLVGCLGVAGGPIALLRRYIRTGEFAVVLTHNRFTLVDRSAEPLLTEAEGLNVGVLNAAPFGGGVLAQGTQRFPHYAYRTSNPATMNSVRQMELLADRHRIPLKAIALQFSLRDERVASTLVGLRSPMELREITDLARLPVAPEVWMEIESLVPPRSDWLG
jgi:D-threo-aldose 1-dehydrogenase